MGVITDRDVACRGIAEGKGPNTPVREVMSSAVITANPDMRIEQCLRMMEENQIRRTPVVNEGGQVCGIVSQADVALHAPEDETAELVRDVSRPSAEHSKL